MRITNQMSMSRMLLNINRNARRVDTLYQQLATGKRIQVPSDNPIIASRALKFRTNVATTEQFIRNSNKALSWMGITEGGFTNKLDLMESIRERLVQGATDTLTPADRDKIVTEMRTFLAQIGGEMNVTYAGRYVFSGFRTDHPPVILSDTDEAFEINQRFSLGNIKDTVAWSRDSTAPNPNEVRIHDIFKIDLPFRYLEGRPVEFPVPPIITMYDAAGVPTPIDVYVVDSTSPASWDNRYMPSAGPPPVVNFIPETGELIFHPDIVADFRAEGPAARLSVDYTVHGLREGELNPIVYFETTRLSDGRVFDMENQELRFEFGVNTRIQINSLAKNVLTANLFAELTNFVNMVADVQFTSTADLRAFFSDPGFGLSPEEIEVAIRDHQDHETQRFMDLLHRGFSSMLGRHDDHTGNTLRENTTLGSRITRIELSRDRMEQNRISFTQLMSENEDVDYAEVIMQMAALEAVFSASLMAGTRIQQMTLADFIR